MDLENQDFLNLLELLACIIPFSSTLRFTSPSPSMKCFDAHLHISASHTVSNPISHRFIPSMDISTTIL